MGTRDDQPDRAVVCLRNEGRAMAKPGLPVVVRATFFSLERAAERIGIRAQRFQANRAQRLDVGRREPADLHLRDCRLCRVAKDRRDDRVHLLVGEIVAHAFEGEQLGAGDVLRESDSVLVGQDRVCSAVDDERRHVE